MLTPFTGKLQSNTTYRFMSFPAGFDTGGVSNVTFFGCRFNGAEPAIFNVQVSGGANITFDYSSFIPQSVTAPPVAHGASSQFGLRENPSNNTVSLVVDHSDFWGFANAVGFAGNGSATDLFTIRNSWVHDARDPGNSDHTDGILNNINNPSSGRWIVIDHNRVVSEGNTNGIALQDTLGDSNVKITNNYISGWGYSIQLGGPPNRNVVFTGNVFGTDIAPDWGPLYGWWAGPGNLWRNNKVHFVPGTHVKIGGHVIVAADDGKFWYPSGDISTIDYAGN